MTRSSAQPFRSVRNPLLQSPAKMPPAETYDDEYKFWPWGDLLSSAAHLIAAKAPADARVTDYMCATGMLLWQLTQLRKDVRAGGCDIEFQYVEFANNSRPHLVIEHADAREFQLNEKHDVIACTAGLHHLPFEEHDAFLEKLRGACDSDTMVVIGEEVLPPYDGDADRVRAALDLNIDLVKCALDRDSSRPLVDAALMVLRNDVLLDGEYKRDLAGWHELIGKYFEVEDEVCSWAAPSGGGDFILVCKPR